MPQFAGEALFTRAMRLERCHLVNDRDQALIFHVSSKQECDDKFGCVLVDKNGCAEHLAREGKFQSAVLM